MRPTPAQLSDLMDFDRVIQVHEDGSVTDAPNDRAHWAPSLLDGELCEPNGWSLLGGYTRQEGRGSIMHNSEFIGGQMARDILARPGFYVSLVCYWAPAYEDQEGESDVDEGWAVAYKEA